MIICKKITTFAHKTSWRQTGSLRIKIKKMEKQKILFANDIVAELDDAIRGIDHDKVFILVDSTTRQLCLGRIEKCPMLADAKVIEIGDTDTHKTLDSLTHVWTELGNGGATRHSLMVNLGGGMITDLGGFAASTFKRGINFINIPTTLLAMVDASVGGKTGINFNGLKNEIGVFSNANLVIIDTQFLKTLDQQNICSGYAEMLKYGLISNTWMWNQLIDYDLHNANLQLLQDMVRKSVGVKERIVADDPLEHGIRKALNLGHTFGHAFESMALERQPVLHGYAVAWGMVCELYLSCIKTGFPVDKMRKTVAYINECYGRMDISCDDYDKLILLMTHDKKNMGNSIIFTLLGEVGDIRINQTASKEEIIEALDFYRDGQ